MEYALIIGIVGIICLILVLKGIVRVVKFVILAGLLFLGLYYATSGFSDLAIIQSALMYTQVL